MSSRNRPRATQRRIRARRIRVASLLVVVAALAAAFGLQVAASSSSTEPATVTGAPRDEAERKEHGRALAEADGAVPDGTTVFDDTVPGVANLDPALLGALRRAATHAAGDGVVLGVDSGWRTPEYQAHLRREAVSKYGSEEEAARWVATPGTSAHVSGDAVDIGPSGAAAWLSAYGAGYGLCQVYANEPWHYELRPEAVAHGCPFMYADASEPDGTRRPAGRTAPGANGPRCRAGACR